jgi:hypothetical protein
MSYPIPNVVLVDMVQLESKRVMETKQLLKYVYYNIVAEFYLRVSSRFLSIATLLDHKAEVYVEKQKAILRKYQ